MENKNITAKMENGKIISFNEYCDAANYGTSIPYLMGIGWQGDGKFVHLAEIFHITEDVAREEYSKWKNQK